MRYLANKKFALMKTIFYFLFVSILVLGCNSDDVRQDQNPNLVNLSFSVDYNLTLPQYSQLNFEGNSFQDYSLGITGINVYYIGNNQYFVYELTDPNHPVVECSTLVVNGLTASCQCDDDNEYNVVNGQQTAGAQGQYSLRAYRAVRNGDILNISN